MRAGNGGWARGASSELVLRGGDGKTQGSWGPAGRLQRLSLPDVGGSPRAALSLLPDQTTSLVFTDRGGCTRTVLGYSPDGAMTLVFADRGGATRARLGVDAAGRASLTLVEEEAAAPEAPVPAGEEGAAPTTSRISAGTACTTVASAMATGSKPVSRNCWLGSRCTAAPASSGANSSKSEMSRADMAAEVMATPEGIADEQNDRASEECRSAAVGRTGCEIPGESGE